MASSATREYENGSEWEALADTGRRTVTERVMAIQKAAERTQHLPRINKMRHDSGENEPENPSGPDTDSAPLRVNRYNQYTLPHEIN